MEGERTELEQQLQNTIDDLTVELHELREKLDIVTKEKDEAIEREHEMEEHIAKMGLVNKEAMDVVAHSVEWGKGNKITSIFTIPFIDLQSLTDVPASNDEAQKYSQLMMKEIQLRELNDKVRQLEEENMMYRRTLDLVVGDYNLHTLFHQYD